MKIRILKKYAKARHTYGHTRNGIRIEMSELSRLGNNYLKRNLRFWTSNWNKKRKFLRKNLNYVEDGFGMIIKK